MQRRCCVRRSQQVVFGIPLMNAPINQRVSRADMAIWAHSRSTLTAIFLGPFLSHLRRCHWTVYDSSQTAKSAVHTLGYPMGFSRGLKVASCRFRSRLLRASVSGNARSGEIEVIRDGTGNAWWHTFVAAETSIVYGALSADVLKTWFTVTGDDDSVQIVAHSQGIDESMALNTGDSIDLEALYFELVDDINAGLERYGRALPSRTDTRAQPELGWNSWYELWDTVDEAAIRDNAALARQYLTARLPANLPRLRLVIDDGWQKGWGNWTANDKFPSGLETLATDLKGMGFETGIWLAPLLVDEDELLVAEHPDWFVPDTTYVHLEHGAMKVLDVTHPDAAQHLRETVARLVSAGFDLLKIDFLFVGTFEGQRYAQVTAMQAYRRALELIRDAAGPDTVLLGVGSPPIAGFDLIDSWRVGPDVAVGAFDASWFFVPNVGRTIAARWPYCLNTLCDGDPPVLRTLERNEVETSIWAAAFAGGAMFLSDDLRHLEPTCGLARITGA